MNEKRWQIIWDSGPAEKDTKKRRERNLFVVSGSLRLRVCLVSSLRNSAAANRLRRTFEGGEGGRGPDSMEGTKDTVLA